MEDNVLLFQATNPIDISEKLPKKSKSEPPSANTNSLVIDTYPAEGISSTPYYHRNPIRGPEDCLKTGIIFRLETEKVFLDPQACRVLEETDNG